MFCLTTSAIALTCDTITLKLGWVQSKANVCTHAIRLAVLVDKHSIRHPETIYIYLWYRPFSLTHDELLNKDPHIENQDLYQSHGHACDLE